MTSTLVTGGVGYIGCHIVAALSEAGGDAVVVDDFSGSSPRAVDALREVVRSPLPVVEGDARGQRPPPAAVFKRHSIDSVVHLAAFKSAAESLAEPLRYYRSNLACTVGVAEAAVEHGVQRLVLSSSASGVREAAVGAGARGRAVGADQPLRADQAHERADTGRQRRCLALGSGGAALLQPRGAPTGRASSGRTREPLPAAWCPECCRPRRGCAGRCPCSEATTTQPTGTAVRRLHTCGRLGRRPSGGPGTRRDRRTGPQQGLQPGDGSGQLGAGGAGRCRRRSRRAHPPGDGRPAPRRCREHMGPTAGEPAGSWDGRRVTILRPCSETTGSGSDATPRAMGADPATGIRPAVPPTPALIPMQRRLHRRGAADPGAMGGPAARGMRFRMCLIWRFQMMGPAARRGDAPRRGAPGIADGALQAGRCRCRGPLVGMGWNPFFREGV